jgi:hypothetical protein
MAYWGQGRAAGCGPLRSAELFCSKDLSFACQWPAVVHALLLIIKKLKYLPKGNLILDIFINFVRYNFQ